MAGASRFSMSAVVSLVDRISGPIATAGKSVDRFATRAQQRMSMTSRAVSGVAGAFRSLIPVLSAGMLFKYANDSIEAWKTQEAAVAMVNQRVKATNGALGITTKQFEDMASAWQKVGIFGDEEILQNVTAQLLTFNNITAGVMNRAQGVVQDVTASIKGVDATAQDLHSTSIMLGKALDDPVRGLSALRRVGITFSDEQEKMIKTMAKNGDMVGAQSKLLEVLESQYGGANEALRKTNAGMERAAKNDMGDTMELIGKQIIPLKQALFEFAAWILPKINAALPTVVSFLKMMAPPVIALVVYFTLFKAVLFATMGIQKLMIGIGWIKYLWMMRAAIMSATGVTSIWTAAQWLLNAALLANPIGLVIAGIAALIGIGYVLYRNWTAIKDFFVKFWNDWQGLITLALMPLMPFINLAKLIIAGWQPVKDFFISLFGYIRSGIDAIMPYIDKISGAVGAVKNFIGGGLKAAESSAREITGRAPAGANASPNTRGITNTNTTNGRLAIDVNTNGNENVAVKQQGKLPPNMSLAYGRAR